MQNSAIDLNAQQSYFSQQSNYKMQVLFEYHMASKVSTIVELAEFRALVSCDSNELLVVSMNQGQELRRLSIPAGSCR